MKQPAISVSIAIFGLLIMGMAVYTYLKHQEMQLATDDSIVTDSVTSPPREPVATGGEQPSESTDSNEESLRLRQTFSDGTHFITGQITLPTPCHSLEQNIVVMESYPEQVVLELSSNPGPGMCAQVMTPVEFAAEIAVSADATFSVTLNGDAVPVELITEPSEPPVGSQRI